MEKYQLTVFLLTTIMTKEVENNDNMEDTYLIFIL